VNVTGVEGPDGLPLVVNAVVVVARVTSTFPLVLLAAKLESPLYVAVMGYATPEALSAVSEMLSVPAAGKPDSVIVPRITVPLVKVTVPVGVPGDREVTVTGMVSVPP
jgi:hypothetical protein